MNNLSAFLNPVKEENVKYIASKRFLDEEGKPIYWEIKPITSTGDEIIRKKYTKMVQVSGKHGQVYPRAGCERLFNQLVYWQNLFADVANFIANCFNDPVSAVQILFYDMASTVIGYITEMAKTIEAVINKIPGVEIEITSGLESFQNALKTKAAEVKSEAGWVEYMQKWDYKDLGEAKKNGYEFGVGLENKVKGFFDPAKFGMDNIELPAPDIGNIPDIGQLTLGDGISDNVKKIADSDIINRDTDQLELLRGLAERTYYDKTIEIKVAMTNNNSINSALDLDGIMGSLVGGLEERLRLRRRIRHKRRNLNRQRNQNQRHYRCKNGLFNRRQAGDKARRYHHRPHIYRLAL